MLIAGVVNGLRAGIAIALVAAVAGCATQSVDEDGAILFPANGAASVSPDTHLELTFETAPSIGTSGFIRIYDAADGRLVDELDMSVPASPRPNGRSQASTEAERQAAARSAEMSDYQVTTIGGVDFHFFPIIVRENTATIYPHHGVLEYGAEYVVEIDPDVLNVDGEAFEGFNAESPWRFTTKAEGPSLDAARWVVAADGSGDFNTVQGAADYAPEALESPVEIFIRDGLYEELVFIRDKSNLVIRGESRDGVEVGYPNNSSFNPPRGGASRRPAFSLYDVEDIQLSDFTIRNYFIGQAEALLVRGERVVIDNMTLDGSGDALTTAGSIYMVDSSLRGDGDTILAYASLFCLRCEISSVGPFTWTRTPEGQHGNVFVDSTFIYLDEPLPWTVTETDPGRKTDGVLARLPRNGAGSSQPNFPYAEMVVINSRMDGVPAVGWGPVEDPETFDWSGVRFMEFGTTDLEGNPIDLSERHPIVRVLEAGEDDAVIANYTTPSYVLGGWEPVVR